MEEYDVIIVGLGCAGLSTAWHCRKNGLKVLGLEMNSKQGAIGSSSYGETRMWRNGHKQLIKDQMMDEALKLWRELEGETGEELITEDTVLVIGTQKNPDFEVFLDKHKDFNSSSEGKRYLTPLEVMEKYPSLENIPSDFQGIELSMGGVVKARKTLEATRKLLETKYETDLRFNTKVLKASKTSVETEKGEVFTAKHVVITTGPYTPESFDKDTTAKKMGVEYFTFADSNGLPGGIIEIQEKDRFYGLLDGPDLTHYKIASFGPRDFQHMLKYMKDRMPSKLDSMLYTHPCYFTMVPSGDHQYKTDKEGIHYAYGFTGSGFKFMPIHGKIVYDGLITQSDLTYIPACFRAKI